MGISGTTEIHTRKGVERVVVVALIRQQNDQRAAVTQESIGTLRTLAGRRHRTLHGLTKAHSSF